jgi:hypothetical protein
MQHGCIRHMHNKRVPRRPLLGEENSFHRLRVERVGPQPVDRLRGERNRAAGTQDLSSLRESLLCCERLHSFHIHGKPDCIFLRHLPVVHPKRVARFLWLPGSVRN